MNKEKPSFADVEQLLTQLAREDAQTELMRGAARGEIRRVFRRRRIRRVAGEVAAVAVLGSTLWFLKPEDAAEAPLAEAGASAHPRSASMATYSPLHKAVPHAAVTPPIAYESRSEACELVIYSVPL